MLAQDSEQDDLSIGREISQHSNDFQNQGESTKMDSKTIFTPSSYFFDFT